MHDLLNLFVFLSFFYWPFYLLGGAIILFLVFRFRGKKSMLARLLFICLGIFGAFALLLALYVIFMLIYGFIINY